MKSKFPKDLHELSRRNDMEFAREKYIESLRKPVFYIELN